MEESCCHHQRRPLSLGFNSLKGLLIRGDQNLLGGVIKEFQKNLDEGAGGGRGGGGRGLYQKV